MQVLDAEMVTRTTDTDRFGSPVSIGPQLRVQRPTDASFDGSFWLGSLQSPTLRLRRAIKLLVSSSDDQIVLEWPEANSLFGYGTSLSAAVIDFRMALAELYSSLTAENIEALGPAMRAVRSLIEQNVSPIVGS
jgi:hypothetical protein